MRGSSRHNRRPIVILMIGLAVWTSLLATGAFLYGYRQDIRKPLIVLGAMILFLGGWGALLLIRAARPSTKVVDRPGQSSAIERDNAAAADSDSRSINHHKPS